MAKLFRGILLIVAFFCSAKCDTPANCTYENVRGIWTFSEGPRGNPKTINCNQACNK